MQSGIISVIINSPVRRLVFSYTAKTAVFNSFSNLCTFKSILWQKIQIIASSPKVILRFCLDKSAFRTADSTNELFPCNFYIFFWFDKQFGGKRHKEHWNAITAPKSRQSLALKCDVNIINTSAQDGSVKNNSP